MLVTLLTAATATNSAPSAATAGAVTRKTGHTSTTRGLAGAQRALLLIKGTVTAGQTLSTTVKLWGYIAAGDAIGWYPLGTSSTAANKGIVNEASALGETTTDAMAHAEVVENLACFDRMYAEITAISGTGASISVYLQALPEVHA